MTPDASTVAASLPATSDSDVYNHTFYGILNRQGEFWTPIAFANSDAAREYLEKFAVSSRPSMLTTHKIVPVRIQLTEIREDAEALHATGGEA